MHKSRKQLIQALSDSDFSYNGLDSLIEHYIKSTINYISSMNISQRAELVSAYSRVLELIRLEYIKFYDEFVLGNLIVVNKIGYKDRITFNESLEEFAIKLKSIKSNYSLSVILTEKLEMKLSGKMKYSNDIRHIEQFLKNCISEIANRGLSIEESNMGFSTIIASRCCEFDDICTSSIVSYRKIKRTVSDLTSGYRVLKSLCKEGEILSKIDGLFNELEKSLTMISSFDLVLKKVDEVTKMLEAIKFKGRVAPKIDRYYNTVIRNESRKCRDADKKAYWDFVSSSLLKIYNSWTSNLYLAADLLVELFREIDVNDREKTDRILSFLNYSTSGIFVRRKESSPSNSDSFGFYILEQAGVNRNSFSIYQINSKGKVKSCPINSSELFQLYLPLEEVVFLKLKYCFRTSDFDGSVLWDESGDYFLLNSDNSYDISVGENGYSYNIIDVLSVNDINRYDMFTSICDFVRKRFREHKNKTDYYRR